MTSRITLVVLLLALGLTSVAADRLLSPFLGPTLGTTGYGKAATQPGPRGYPRQTVDSDGVIVRIERKPSRIVSQYWSIDEYLYAVVPPERVVGVSESAYLPNVSNVLHQVLRFQPLVASTPENVLRLRPDLIVVSSSSSSDLTSLPRSTAPATKVEEFGCKPASDSHATGKPGENKTMHQFHRVMGGFLAVQVRPAATGSKLVIERRDVHGARVYGRTYEKA